MKLRHGRVDLVLHEWGGRGGDGLPLLLLHQVGGSAEDWRAFGELQDWPGPVFALDFAGHGGSAHVKGGGYYPEFHLADADVALEAIGDRAALVGAGVGAYAAFLLAGARPDRIPAALLLPGRGLLGGGEAPEFGELDMPGLEEWQAQMAADARCYAPGTDPGVARSERDLRPSDYTGDFARGATRLLLSESLPAAAEAGWLRIAGEAECSEPAPRDLAAALRLLAASCG